MLKTFEQVRMSLDIHATYIKVLAETGPFELVGRLIFSTDASCHPNEIEDIWVHPAHRRQGIATRMLQEARKANPAHRTDAGEAWAQSLGEAVPPRVATCDCGCDFEPELPR